MSNFSKKKLAKKIEIVNKMEKDKDGPFMRFIKTIFAFIFKVIKLILVIIAIISIIACIILGILYHKYGTTYLDYKKEAVEIVDVSTPDTFIKNLSSYIYDDNNKLISKLSIDSNSDYLTYDKIPADVVNAFVAIEDREFWNHNGFDLNGIIRVCYRYVMTKGAEKHGASTITQQLARSVFLTNEVSIDRKIKEIILSMEIEKKYSKEQIIEFYINGAYFANRYYGIEAASEGYFNKSVSELNLSEIAYLCAIPNAPTYYDPLKNIERPITRRDKILTDMLECGYISESDYKDAIDYEIVLDPYQKEEFQNYETTYAVDCAIRYLMQLDEFEFKYKFEDMKDYKNYLTTYNETYEEYRDKLYTGGYKVYTSLSEEKQNILQNAIDDVMSFNKETNENGYALQSASTIIDNKTHKVVAIVGGRTEENTSTYTLNRAYQSYRQPGSTFKPIAVYAPALDNGYTASSILQNIDIKKAKEMGLKASTLTGRQMALRTAVEQSKNGCAWWLFCKLTPQKALTYVTNMKFAKIVPDDYYPASALGGLTYGTTTVEMAGAYSALANGGSHVEPTCLISLKDRNGNELYQENESQQIYSPGAAYKMIDIMKGVIKRGTAKSMKWKSDVEAAGKTGTTNDCKDGWFCGVIPDYSMSVWVGYDEPKILKNLYGATYPAQIWKNAMLQLIDDNSTKEFTVYEDDEMDINQNGADEYYNYLPGRDDDEVLSNNYTVRNYREDHMLADNAEKLLYEITTLDPAQSDYKDKSDALYEEAKELIDQIYSRKLYQSESEKLKQTEELLQKAQ